MKKGFLSTIFLSVILGIGVFVLGGPSSEGTASAVTAICGRTIFADVVALDQPFYFNRLGAINPNGMMYALARDVVVAPNLNPAIDPLTGLPFVFPDVAIFEGLTIPEFDAAGGNRADLAGQVVLRADKRPRPIVLRMDEQDCLNLNFTNLLDPIDFIFKMPADFPTGPILGLGVPIPQQIADQPLTRVASIHIDGLYLEGDIGSDGSNVGQNTPSSLVAPGDSTVYTYFAEHEATHLMYSMGATMGADGAGGSRTYGLFGAVNVQKQGAEWYRSQLTRQEMDWAASAWVLDPTTNTWMPSANNIPQGGPVRTTPGGQPVLNYDAVYPAEAGPGKEGLPIINMLRPGNEIVHTDINAIITGPNRGRFDVDVDGDGLIDGYTDNQASGDRNAPYREFTVIFHDDQFAVQAFPGFYNDPVLGHTLAGVADAFPINYGSGGIGSEIVANRLGVGPMWDCAECKYEEFFLTSWTVGDPAMVVDIPANTTDALGNIIPGAKATKALFPDDPSNVHHSYLSDRVKFRNLHAGPKEHHIFHLHAHQWLFNPDDPQSNYLDGQAIGPGSGYTYEIAYGGSGNRNKTPGDSIFHCHFYPHFAQGMWEMWRTHDTFEQGTIMDIDPADGLPIPAAGSRALPDGEIVAGTPIPGVVPIPTNPMAIMPDPAAKIVASDLNGDGQADSSQFDANGDNLADIFQLAGADLDGDNVGDPLTPPATNPGYPWYIPGVLGHRPPTPAMDMMVDFDGDTLPDVRPDGSYLGDGGLPRHVISSGPDENNPAHAGAPVEMYVSRLDFNKIVHEASAIQIPEVGTAVEQVAMNFHSSLWQPTFLPDGTPVGTTSATLDVGSADGGTFTLSVDGTTTGAIAYNALAGDVEAALSAVGVPASVTGNGSTIDPWHINFNGNPVISVDAASLTQTPVTAASAAVVNISEKANVHVGSADGGTFTLSVGGITTGPIAYNASAIDVQNALSAVGISASVTGVGSFADPWVITLSGTPVVLMDSANLTDSLGPLTTAASVTVASTSNVVHVDVGSADGGTFTLSFDLGAPIGPINWDASATEVQTALTSAGVSVTAPVSGTGSLADPWLITLSGTPVVSMDSANLTEAAGPLTTPASATLASTSEVATVDVGSADGGTFTLSFDLGAPIGPINWDASATAIQTALTSAGVSVTAPVSGTGSLADPWVISLSGTPDVSIDGTNLTQTPVAAFSLSTNTNIIIAGNGRQVEGFETNGLPATAGSPYADPCRAFDGSGNWTLDYPNGTVRTIKGANIEMAVVLNKVGWHFQQQRFEALWEDVVPTLTNAKAPEPMIMRLNSTDCAEFHHTNLVPNVYQLDDFQVRTPTDIIGQHIHLVKFDVTSADGSANGWNYEDGTLSPDEVRERIDALNNGGGMVTTEIDPVSIQPVVNSALAAEAHPFFGATGPTGQNWLGARTTIQRWYADPLLERSWDGGVGTVFTHDHYGPSTHQQVGLYSTLLVEPKGSIWKHNETGARLGTRTDGGPTTWQATIESCVDAGAEFGITCETAENSTHPDAEFDAHREFYFEFADFQHAYERNGGALITQPNENLLGPSVNIPSYADFASAINPSFRLPPANPEDIYVHPNWCPGTTFDPATGAPLFIVPRPCPEAISADDPGTYALNFRNEPIGLRVFDGVVGADGPGGVDGGQAPGLAGDLAFAYQSRTDRAIPELNVQPETNGISPYPPLTADVRPGDPWTPMLRVYMGDQVRIRVQVGAHEEEHNFTIPGLKWRKEPNSPNSGWKNSEFFGIDEYFNLDVPIIPDTQKTGGEVDYIYTVGAELEGMWNGVWGIMRSYTSQRKDLYELPNNDIANGGYDFTNNSDGDPNNDFDGMCPTSANIVTFDVTAVRALDVLDPTQGLVYNDRLTTLRALPGGITGQGPLIDPTATIYVLNQDLVYDAAGNPIDLKLNAPVEPLILRVNAGDCVLVNLTNALPDDLSGTEMPGWNSMVPIVQKDENLPQDGVGGILTFNANDIIPSSYVGLTPQLLAFDPKTEGGFSTGLTTGKLVPPDGMETYKWYAGDVTVVNGGVVRNKTQFTISATPVEFGAAGLMPADRIKGSENGMVGAIIVEPQDSCWIADPGTRAQATVWKGANDASDGTGNSLIGECQSVPASSTDSFRDFVTIMQNDVNLRYGGFVEVLGVVDPGTGVVPVIETIDCSDPGNPNDPTQPNQMARMECAVPNIAAEGPLGPTEESQDSGQKAINYKSDPMWFRMGVVPDFFQIIHRDAALKDLIPQAYSNYLDLGDGLGPVGEPQTQIFNASPTGPQYGRMRVLMPGGHARGTIYTLHGHQWQSQPYINNSTEIGDRSTTSVNSEYYGAQEGINPTGHWDFLIDLGGPFDVLGDYLWRDQAAFGSFQGLWGLLRFNQTAPVALDIVRSIPKYVLVPGTTDTYSPGSVELDLLALAFDLDGFDPASAIVDISIPPDFFGSVSTPVNGVVTYTYPDWPFAWPCPTNSLVCPAIFTYTITDGQGNVSEPGTVTINVTNSAPVANNDTVQITEENVAVDVQVPVLANDIDAEGDLSRTPLSVVLVDPLPFDQNGLTAGTATLNLDNTIQYVNNDPTFRGVARFRYTVEDESGAISNQGVVRVAIRVDSIVITGAQWQEANGKWTIAGTCSIPGNTITIYSGDTIEEDVRGPVIGTAICALDNTFLFGSTSTAPDPLRDQLNYVSALSDGLGFDEGFPLRFAGRNNAPVATDNTYVTEEDTTLLVATPGVLGVGVLANDLDADFDPLTAVLVSGPANGSLILNLDGSFNYTPDADWNSYDGCPTAPATPCSDSFTYQATDGQDMSNLATVTITVDPVNDVPTAVADLYVMDPISVQVLNVPAEGVLANDFDVEGDLFFLDTTMVNSPTTAGNTLVLNADGSFSYAPNPTFSGTDTFQYRICEESDPTVCGTGTVTINVGVNTAPVARDDTAQAEQTTATQVTPATGNVLDNDTDTDGDPLIVSAVNGAPANVGVQIILPSGGTLTVLANGGFTYTPELNFVGEDSFTYVARDAEADSNTATVTITVIDRVTITSAQYRDRQSRWSVQGTVSNATSTIEVYRNSVAPENLIGTANVDPISGAWDLNTRTGPVAIELDQVIAVSSFGGISALFPVIVR